MAYYNLFSRMAWMVDFVQNNPGSTLQEIKDAWYDSSLSLASRLSFSERTFRNDKNDIECLSGICFTYKNRGYHIELPANTKVFESHNWFLEFFRRRVLFEQCHLGGIGNRIMLPSFPSENGWLIPIAEAMHLNRKIAIQYNASYIYPASERIIEPYCTRIYDYKLYVLGKCEDGILRVFAFDRISDIKILKENFVLKKGFDPEEYFADFYGVFTNKDGMTLDNIKLRISGKTRENIRKNPLHHSQIEMTTEETYSDFIVRVYPTNDFLSRILKEGAGIEIIEPQSVRERFANLIFPIADMYKDLRDNYQKTRLLK